MRKNWLAAAWAHWFRAEPLVPDAAFQGPTEPYPGHWREFPELWPAVPTTQPEAAARISELAPVIDAALTDLPEPWRRVVLARALAQGDDQQVADDLGLTLEQERDILARARAAVRDRLDQAWTDGPR